MYLYSFSHGWGGGGGGGVVFFFLLNWDPEEIFAFPPKKRFSKDSTNKI